MEGADDVTPIADDGLPARAANPWARYKLDIVECYVPAFVRACKKAPVVQLVDAFCGPGLNRFADDGEVRPGTTLIALNAGPPPTRVLAVDKGQSEADALAGRCEPYGQRAVVRRGDANVELVPLMSEFLQPRAPTLCLFDPEGTELHFTTIQAASQWGQGRTKPELLILLPTHTGFLRMLWDEVPDWAPEKMDRLYGTDGWREVHRARRDGHITPDEATTRYVQLYAEQLRTLGYNHVLDREIREGGRRGRLGYFLLFASQHPAGKDIMEHCFNDRFGDEREPPLFRDRRSRLDG